MISARLFEYALNTLWQLPLLAASTWLLIRLARPSVVFQHALWIATLLLAAVLPLRGVSTSSVLHSSGASSSMSGTTSTSLSTYAPLHLIQLTPSLIRHIARLWALALAFNLFRLAQAWITARRLIAASRPLEPEALDPAILRMCADLLQIPVPEIRLTPASTPAVAGILKPVLLLPIHLTHHYELPAVLLHEFAHIRRRDTFTNLLCRFIALPIAWHPITPLLHTRIAQTREILCDALAAQATGSPTLYARSLITLFRDLQSLTQPSLTQGLFSASSNPSALEERIMTLITPRTLTPASRAMRIAAGVVVILTASGIAAAFHLQSVAAAQIPTANLIPAYSRTPLNGAFPLAEQPSTSSRPFPAPSYITANSGSMRHAATSAPIPQDLPNLPALPATPAPAVAPAAPAARPVRAEPPSPHVPDAPIAPAAAQAVHAPFAAPTPTPTPEPAPPPAPAPTHHPRHIAIVNGVQRDLTPEESAALDRQLAAAQKQIEHALGEHLVDEEHLKIQLKSLSIPQLDRQMADLRKQLQSPDFQRQIAAAQKIAIDKAMNSEEVKQQLNRAAQQIKMAQTQIAKEHINIKIDQARMQQQMKAAAEALAGAHIDVHIDTAQIQKQLETARKQIEEARRNYKVTAPQP